MNVCDFPGQSPPPAAARSLTERDHTEQIRTALANPWRLPKVDEATLARYYLYLCKKLAFPFAAWYPNPAEGRQAHKACCWVAELIDPANGVGDTFDGIFCKVHHGQQALVLPLIELELPPESANYHLVESYWYWFWHWR